MIAQPARNWLKQGEWTYDAWVQLPEEGTRYEVIDGVLYVTPLPSTTHQFTVGSLSRLVSIFADAGNLGVALEFVGVRLPAQPVPFTPDIVYVSAARKQIIGTQYIEGVPELIVEVLSANTWDYDRIEKFQVYQTAGVPEYWIVDYRAKTVEVFVLEQGEYTLIGKWGVGDSAESRVLVGFKVAVADIFRDIT